MLNSDVVWVTQLRCTGVGVHRCRPENLWQPDVVNGSLYMFPSLTPAKK
ncbi:hypothetical protein HanXRQr2_Chr16g0777401 [Helianthus annuus]|uniref:Uncharacterized protein n=1 Tax=Helianthus annuus TaxID=4232 RepID=A0A9K3DXR6_HELAN|nr:hypothetical protein HanXRQr2_Chr16g0777401 [Helianthus annuus]